MADKTPKKRGPGRPPSSDKARQVTFSVNQSAHDYLTWLIDNSMYGESANVVAKHLLTERLNQLRENGFHLKKLPTED